MLGFTAVTTLPNPSQNLPTWQALDGEEDSVPCPSHQDHVANENVPTTDMGHIMVELLPKTTRHTNVVRTLHRHTSRPVLSQYPSAQCDPAKCSHHAQADQRGQGQRQSPA
jgi:hypothetical protein